MEAASKGRDTIVDHLPSLARLRTMATPATAAPPRGAHSYLEWYDTKPDQLTGGYGPLYERHAIANGIGGLTLLRQALQATQAIPKVYLILTERDGSYEIRALHRPTTYELDLIVQTSWDGRDFAFIGDVRGGNFIKTVKVPADIFEFLGGANGANNRQHDGSVSRPTGWSNPGTFCSECPRHR